MMPKRFGAKRQKCLIFQQPRGPCPPSGESQGSRVIANKIDA